MFHVYVKLAGDVERRILAAISENEAKRLKDNFESRGASVRIVPVPS